MKSIFALVDCNNFYASCEKLFDPKLKDRPVVVLSNNDGCVVARSAEVKALGIPMGVPWFQIQAEARRYGIVAFSSNYALYADMSNRVVEVLSDFSPNLEVYSIDESFLDLSGMSMRTESLAAYGVEIRQRVADWLGLAVCVGIAPTKTLAKLANHCAKKGLAGADGVCDFTTLSPGALSHLFARIEVGEVWGVGRQIKARLAAMGIQTVGQLRDADAETIRARFSVVLERTVSELRGESCLDLQEVVPDKQQIMSSRSFGTLVYERVDLEEAVASYIAKAAEKLRAQDSLAGGCRSISGPMSSSLRFRNTRRGHRTVAGGDRRYAGADTVGHQNFEADLPAGVWLSQGRRDAADLVPAAKRQLALFDSQGGAGDARSGKLMAVLDDINQRYGRQSLRLAAEGSSALGRCGGVTCRRAIRRVGTDCRWRMLAVMDS
jgi:DNA polymerase V